MPSSPRSPDEFINSFEASFAGFLPGDLLRSKEHLIARATHPGVNLKLETTGDNFEAIQFNVFLIGQHIGSWIKVQMQGKDRSKCSG
jgi:hypothetical protein